MNDELPLAAIADQATTGFSVNPPYYGDRSTRDGGTWEWFTGEGDFEATLTAIRRFIDGGRTTDERLTRLAMIKNKLTDASLGDLLMFVKPEKWHDVRPITKHKQLLELRWKYTDIDPKTGEESTLHYRLYFSEPKDVPAIMRGLVFEHKTSDDAQDEHLNRAEKIRVESTKFASG